MKLVVLQKTRLEENLGTLFEVNKLFAIGSLFVGRVSAIAAISLDGLLGVELLEQIAQATLPISFVEL